MYVAGHFFFPGFRINAHYKVLDLFSREKGIVADVHDVTTWRETLIYLVRPFFVWLVKPLNFSAVGKIKKQQVV